jgi:hypothetical protein
MMTLDFSILSAAQRRYVVCRYNGQCDDETIATLRVLERMGWVDPHTLRLTADAKKAYEYWLAWGDTEEIPGGTTWVGGHKISKSFLQKMERVQAAARQAIEQAGA